MERPSRPSSQQSMQNQQGMFNTQDAQRQQNMYRPDATAQQRGGNMQGMAVPMSEEEYLMQLQMKKKKGKKIAIIIVCVILGLAALGVLTYFVGSARWSSKVRDLEASVAQWEIDYKSMMSSKNSEIDKLKEAIADTTVLETEKVTSLQTVEGQYVPQMWLLNGQFISPNPLKLPYVTEGINDSYIQIGQRFVFRPSDRWMFVSKGSTFELSHPNGIWGKIRALGARDNIPQGDMKQIIQNFFIGYPATEISYRSIYIEDRISGMLGNAVVTVKYNAAKGQSELLTQKDVNEMLRAAEEGIQNEEYDFEEKEMTLCIGFIQRSDYAIEFLFLYNNDDASTSQELIDLFLRSGSLGASGSGIKLEQ